MAMRSLGGVALRLGRQWWPHLAALAAACGIVAATIAGAIGVGDSLTRGLRQLAMARLGGIQAAVLSDGFFHAGLATETTNRLRSQATRSAALGRLVPAVVLEVSLQAAEGDRAGRTVRATLLACDDLDALGFADPSNPPEANAVAINRPLADSLGARPGDPIVLRITKAGDVPADSPLGRRTADSWSRRLTVHPGDRSPGRHLAGHGANDSQAVGNACQCAARCDRHRHRRRRPGRQSHRPRILRGERGRGHDRRLAGGAQALA